MIKRFRVLYPIFGKNLIANGPGAVAPKPPARASQENPDTRG
jgi:hypothetical protein